MTRHHESTLPGLQSVDALGVSLLGNELSTVQLFQDNTRTPSSPNVVPSTQDHTRRTSKRNVQGNNASETLKGTSKGDRINGQGGDDKINGKQGNDKLDGGRGNDTIQGGGGNDKIDGGAGNDTLKGSGGNDRIKGNTGQDLIKGGGGSDTLMGGDGNDTIQGGAGDDRLDGGAGNDELDGGRGSDRLFGRDGNDTLRINDLTDVAVGGAGDDLYVLSVALPSGGLVEQVGGGNDTVVASVAFRLPTTVENLTLSGVQSNTINMQSLTAVTNALATFVPGSNVAIGQGNASANVMVGSSASNDILSGEAGNDRVSGGLGHDALLGGLGDDWLNGQGGDDLLYGGAGIDTLIGGVGNDRLIGGPGRDRLEGGEGNDVYVIASNATYRLFDNDDDGDNDAYRIEAQLLAEDTIIELADEGIDTIQASGTVLLPSNIENLVLVGGTSLPLQAPVFGTQNIDAFTSTLNSTSNYAIGAGNELDNILIGNASNNFLFGDLGEDQLNGGAGADYLEGGQGKDSLNGGDGDDLIIGDGDDVLIIDNSSTIFPDRGNDRLNGGNGNDVLVGGRGSDVLNGDNGNDFLMGHLDDNSNASVLTTFLTSTEKDRMTGGAGADVFALGSSTSNTVFYGGEGFATITDFNALEGDFFGIVGSTASYSLESAQVLGTAALDTQILYQGNVIAVVQDTTDVFLELNFFNLS